jgi:NAD(P)-dependent dehydrogenase (short-subunit alcohol dehydrogenase family)
MTTPQDFSVAGKHVLISGGIGGIDVAFANAFTLHRANVIVWVLAPPKEGMDARIKHQYLDVRSDAAVSALAERIPKLDVLIHCAGRVLPFEEYEDCIRVNAIAPGFIKTEMSRAGREEPEYNDKVVARIPSGERSDPEELAGAAIFLASSASRLINGVTIPIDGGYTAT